ncbi:MAG: hypothetical protein WD994_04830, partial [Pseudomonadales bacterium]
EEGKLDDTSESRLSISLAIYSNIEINTDTDISINVTDRSVDASFVQPFCVQGRSSDKYTLMAPGTSEDGTAFVLENQEREVLPYYLFYSGNPNTADFEPLLPGIASGPYDLLPRNTTCDGQTTFQINLKSRNLEQAGSGLFSGSLTLLVSPV